MQITYYGNDILRQECKDVVVDGNTLKKAEEMVRALDKYNGIGLAGPQVGLSEKIIVIRLNPEDEPIFIFNLRLIDYSEEKNVIEEGCLSLPGIYEKVVRPEKVHVKYQDASGEWHDKELEGIMARVFQHEGDHLYGVLFIDHISAVKKRLLKKKLDNIRKGNIDIEFIPEEDR